MRKDRFASESIRRNKPFLPNIGRRAETDPLHVVVGAIIVLTVLVVSIVVFARFFGEGSTQTKCHIENLKLDCDCDGKPNAIDPCPCDPDDTKSGNKCAKPQTCISADCKCSGSCDTSESNAQQSTPTTPTPTTPAAVDPVKPER